MNQAPRKAATQLHTRRRRRWSTSLFSGPTEATPPAAAAFEVPTAGVPTYVLASVPRALADATVACAAAGRGATGGAGLSGGAASARAGGAAPGVAGSANRTGTSPSLH